MKTNRVAAVIAFAVITSGTLARAADGYPYESPCETVAYNDPVYGGDPRVVRESVAFDGAEHRFEVLLPGDYATSGARYPVLYLLHGWTMNEDSWLGFTDIEGLIAPFTADDRAAIVIMPRGRGFAWDLDYRDGRRSWETLLTRVIVPYVDEHYRTLPDRRHRALAGLSGGGFTTTIYMPHRPDLFAAGGIFSGPAPTGVVAPFVIDRGLTGCTEGPVAMATGTGIVGDPVRDELWYHDIDAVELAPNLRGSDLYIASGNGVPCDERDVLDITSPPSRVATAWQLLEVGAYVLSIDIAGKLRDRGVSVTTDIGCGIHSWRHWERMLATFWDFMFDSFAKPEPTTFDYRRPLASFFAFDWTFETDPGRAPEFLDIIGAGAGGVTLSGSGLTSVTSAPLFAPGSNVGLDGAIEDAATAADDGRIRFTVDLGPPHTAQQYTPQARLSGQDDPGYFTTRHVVFSP
jgi:S-formylglutathione hydrolase FrmB